MDQAGGVAGDERDSDGMLANRVPVSERKRKVSPLTSSSGQYPQIIQGMV